MRARTKWQKNRPQDEGKCMHTRISTRVTKISGIQGHGSDTEGSEEYPEEKKWCEVFKRLRRH